jgi:hypothetical protein
MLTSAPECRTVCNGKPGDVVEQLIVAFKGLRARGWSEEQALNLSRDSKQVAALLPNSSLGALHSVAEAVVLTGCAECAVNYAYAK